MQTMRRFLACAALACATGATAQSELPDLGERFRHVMRETVDPVDGQFDLSAILEHAAGFLPIPIVVTEPAVGYGGGLVALFVRPRREAGGEGYARPDLAAVGGIATENGTRMALAGDMRRWLDGRLRTLVGVAGGDINLDFYALGDSSSDFAEAVRYTLAIKGGGAQIDWQLAERSPWSVGLRLIYADVEPKLRDDPLFPGLEDRIHVKIAGPGLALMYDTRDNVFTPTRGLYGEVGGFFSDDAFGANRDFQRYDALLMGWWPLASTVTLGARVDYQQSTSGAPFFMRPFIAMRGIPAMRYPGNKVATAQLEARWQFYGRWSVVGFGGVGQARLDQTPVKQSTTKGAGGLGFRYELARKFGLHAGLDLARGPDDTTVYITVGSAWMRP